MRLLQCRQIFGCWFKTSGNWFGRFVNAQDETEHRLQLQHPSVERATHGPSSSAASGFRLQQRQHLATAAYTCNPIGRSVGFLSYSYIWNNSINPWQIEQLNVICSERWEPRMFIHTWRSLRNHRGEGKKNDNCFLDIVCMFESVTHSNLSSGVLLGRRLQEQQMFHFPRFLQTYTHTHTHTHTEVLQLQLHSA